MTGYDISFYGSHNAAYAISKNGKIIGKEEDTNILNANGKDKDSNNKDTVSISTEDNNCEDIFDN